MNKVTTDLLKKYERDILTMILGDKLGNKETIINSLMPEMFTQSFHRTVFEACVYLQNKKQDVNKFSLMELIGNKEQAAVIEQIYEEFITNVNYQYFVNKLQHAYIDRLIKQACTQKDMDRIQEIRDFCADTSCVIHFSEGAENLICDYYNNQEGALLTGFPSIDRKVGALQGGEYIIIAGATSMGKTCFALNMIKRMAERNTKCLVFSLEMGKKSLQNRMICSETGIAADKFKTFSMTVNEQMEYQNAAENLKYYPIYICTDSDIDVQKIRKICKKTDCDVIFIDYLGLICNKSAKNAYERVSENSRALKNLAREIDKPIIVLAQLSRAIKERKDKTPLLSDLKDSGQIENDADMVNFVYRPGYYDDQQSKSLLYFINAKNRNGKANNVISMRIDLQGQRIFDNGENYKNEQRTQASQCI